MKTVRRESLNVKGNGSGTRDQGPGTGMSAGTTTPACGHPSLSRRGVAQTKCPSTGVPVDVNVCIVNKTRNVRGCKMCLEVGI